MSNKSSSETDQDMLTIQVCINQIPVSYLSSLLRVLQAALREVAQSDDRTRRQFDQRPQPVLLLAMLTGDGGPTLHFIFADPHNSMPLKQLSAQTFNSFLDRFAEFVRCLPQPGLWGGAARRPQQRPPESELTRRMDQVHRELRRSPMATMRFRGRSIEVEGDRMAIS